MATLELALANSAEAERLFAHMAEIRRQTLGPRHPDTLLSLHSLGVALFRREAYTRARSRGSARRADPCRRRGREWRGRGEAT